MRTMITWLWRHKKTSGALVLVLALVIAALANQPKSAPVGTTAPTPTGVQATHAQPAAVLVAKATPSQQPTGTPQATDTAQPSDTPAPADTATPAPSQEFMLATLQLGHTPDPGDPLVGQFARGLHKLSTMCHVTTTIAGNLVTASYQIIAKARTDVSYLDTMNGMVDVVKKTISMEPDCAQTIAGWDTLMAAPSN